MNHHLPQRFLDKMNEMLGPEEYSEFLASYGDDRLFGLRINTLKSAPADVRGKVTFSLSPIPWCETGFYYSADDRPGKHPYYHCGLYYIQEPSAMVPAELLGVKPGDKVLDLCAAPGGKSTQIAAKLGGEGLLVVNDIHADRVKALVKNIELAGVRNAVVLNENPAKLTKPFAGFFDKILIDAPCSGEGMFRKDEDMVKQWDEHTPARYAAMQRELLAQGADMLAAGGTLVYSTCTFSPEENEAIIAQFIGDRPDFEVVPQPTAYGFRPGRPDWIDREAGGALAARLDSASQVSGTVRLWPHHVRGEGHYAAVLRRQSAPAEQSAALANAGPAAAAHTRDVAVRSETREERKSKPRGTAGRRPSKPEQAGPSVNTEPFREFWRTFVAADVPGEVTLFGEHLYITPASLPDLSGIRVIRPGLYAGAVHKGRFEPAHALALALKREQCARTVSLDLESAAAIRYLKGETLDLDEDQIKCASGVQPKGRCLVCIDGFPAGWGKWLDGMLKNEYPAGWRWT